MRIDYAKLVDEYMWANGPLNSAPARGKRFLDWILLKLFNRTETELDNNDLKDGVLYTDGAGDYGIDCAFVDGDVLYLIQSKYRSNHSYDNVYHFLVQIKDFLDLDNARSIRSRLTEVFDKVRDEDIREIKIYYITDNFLKEEVSQYNYKEKTEEIEEIYSKRFGKNVSLKIIGYESFQEVHTGILFELPPEAKTAKHNLSLERYFENRDKTTIVAEVSLKNLATMVKQHKNYIFSSNIRNYKGLNKINKGIRESYYNNPKDFWYYNNGITIVCNDYILNEYSNSLVSIFAPQIVNGCQTATTIYNCWIQSNEYDRENNQGTILVKIIKDNKKNKRNNITKYTNSQTAVTGKDFFALDEFHKELKEKFEEYGYFYETQSNSSKVKTVKHNGTAKYYHLFDAKFNKNNVLMAKEVTQTYIATILEMPAKAKNIGEFMPGCAKYEAVYNDKTPYDPRFYILPYGVWYYLRNVFELPENKVLDKDKWSTSLLFTSYIFFKIISKNYCEGIKMQDEKFIDVCEEKIVNVDEFKKLINLTYNVLRDFYKDSAIKEIIGDNLPRFLKAAVETNSKVKEILDNLIYENS